jgi:ubiquitin-like 1-activating enzyme E1 B
MQSTTTKLSNLQLIYGNDVADKITTCNTLVVGAGGIGCEVMKTLSVTGFRKVTIVRR